MSLVHSEHVAMARTKDQKNELHRKIFLMTHTLTHANLDAVGQHHGPRMGFTAAKPLGSNPFIWAKTGFDGECSQTATCRVVGLLEIGQSRAQTKIYLCDFEYSKILSPLQK